MNAFDESAINKFKSYFLMFCFSLVIIALGYVFGMIYGRGNTGTQMFPGSVVAGMFNFKQREFFKTEEAEKEPVKVKFD